MQEVLGIVAGGGGETMNCCPWLNAINKNEREWECWDGSCPIPCPVPGTAKGSWLHGPGWFGALSATAHWLQGLGRFRLLPNHQIRGKMGSGVQMREFNLMSRSIFLRDKAISSNMELWVSFNSL